MTKAQFLNNERFQQLPDDAPLLIEHDDGEFWELENIYPRTGEYLNEDATTKEGTGLVLYA